MEILQYLTDKQMFNNIFVQNVLSFNILYLNKQINGDIQSYDKNIEIH